MKKILIVNDGFPPHTWGGANTISFLHAKSLQKRGFDVRVFTTTQDKAVPAAWGEYAGVPVRTFYTNYHPRWWAYKSLNNRQVTQAFEHELKAFGPHIVHFHNIHHYFSYRTIVLAKQSGAKVFLTAHDVMSFAYQKLHHFINYFSKDIPTSFTYHVPWWVNLKDAKRRFNPLRNLIIRRYLRDVDQIFAVSNALKQALEDNGISGNVSVVHNGIDALTFDQYVDEVVLREKLGLHGSKTILFVGRFTLDKGCGVALTALAKITKNVPEAKLLIVGYDLESGLDKLINTLGIKERVVFVASSPLCEIYTYYRVADCILVPSIIFDSFPTVNLEAMAARKPVVATCFGGSKEAVVDGVTGYIINPLDIERMVEILTTLLTNAALSERLGAAGRERLVDTFSLEQQMTSLIEYYERAM